MKKIFIVLLLGFAYPLLSQTLQATAVSTHTFEADRYIGMDNFGALYGIRQNAFVKSLQGQTLEYRNLRLGKIARADLQNPLGILLFYEDFNTVVLLDNQLNEIRMVSFSELPQPLMVSAAGTAAQNRFWIYDNLSMRIGYYDFNTGKFTALTPALNGRIVTYDTDFNYFYWVDDKQQLYACDLFGKVRKLSKVETNGPLIMDGPERFFFLKAGTIYWNNTLANEAKAIENVGKSFSSFSYKDEILSIFTGNVINSYKIIIP